MTASAVVVVLVCAAGMHPSDCNEQNAVSVTHRPAHQDATVIGSCFGAQPFIAGLAFAPAADGGTYMKIKCKVVPDDPSGRPIVEPDRRGIDRRSSSEPTAAPYRRPRASYVPKDGPRRYARHKRRH